MVIWHPEETAGIVWHYTYLIMVLDFITAHLALLSELLILVVLLFAFIIFAGVLIARLDRLSVEDGIYFAFVTALTIGFGDFVPKSRGARSLSIILATIGIVIFGIIVSVTVHALDVAIESAGLTAPAATTD